MDFHEPRNREHLLFELVSSYMRNPVVIVMPPGALTLSGALTLFGVRQFYHHVGERDSTVLWDVLEFVLNLFRGPRRPHKYKDPHVSLQYHTVFVWYIWYMMRSTWYMSVGILQTVVSGFPLVWSLGTRLEPQGQNVGSLCLCGLLDPYRLPRVTIRASYARVCKS